MISNPISWNTHSLITLTALKSADFPESTDETRVVPLETFLQAAGPRIAEVAHEYWNQVAKKARAKKKFEPEASAILTTADFLRAAGMSSMTVIQYVRVIDPSEVSPDAPHEQTRYEPPDGPYRQVLPDETMTVRDVLVTYSDEPDWGMDQNLFSRNGYGYGESPFGGAMGQSSQGPFHMAFPAEGPLMVAVLPELKVNFVEERVWLFRSMAALAFDVGMDYWGWRFGSWSTHYCQDITQPYHAKAFPFPIWRVVLRYFKERGPIREFAERNKALLINRHHLFEGIVHYLMNEAVKGRGHERLLTSLKGDGSSYDGPIRDMLAQTAIKSSQMGCALDLASDRLMKDANMLDPRYSLAGDPLYSSKERVEEAIRERPEAFGRFCDLLCECLERAGKVTRYSVLQGRELQSNSNASARE